MTQISEHSQDARAIANYILDEAPKYGIDDLSPMKLLKLIFLAHGWSFYFCEEPLIAEQPEAWQYGPVYPTVYNRLRKYGSNPVRERIMDKDTEFPYQPNLTEKQKQAIKAILERYGKMSAFRLSSLTHLEGSPWSEAMASDTGTNREITHESMKKYYTDMAKEMGLPE